MKKLSFLLFASFLTLSLYAQEEILDMCMVFTIDTEDTELRKAAFDLPFPAGRSGEEPTEIKHYYFPIGQPEGQPTITNVPIYKISNVRPYEFGEECANNELAVLVAQYDMDKEQFGPFSFPIDLTKVMASFPSMNDMEVPEIFLYVENNIILPGRFNTLTRGQLPEIKAGYYVVQKKMIKP